MKKIIVFLTAVLICANIQGQDFRFGAQIGGNIASIAGESDEGAFLAPAGGAFIGALAEYEITGFFGLRAELYYSQQGTKLVYSNKIYKDSATTHWAWSRRTNNLNIPVLAKLDIIEDRLSILAGPQFDFCFSGKDYWNDLNGRGASLGSLAWSRTAFNHFDIGLLVGIEFMIGDHFGIMGRYSWGFVDIFTKQLLMDAYGKNRIAQIGFEYKF